MLASVLRPLAFYFFCVFLRFFFFFFVGASAESLPEALAVDWTAILLCFWQPPRVLGAALEQQQDALPKSVVGRRAALDIFFWGRRHRRRRGASGVCAGDRTVAAGQQPQPGRGVLHDSPSPPRVAPQTHSIYVRDARGRAPGRGPARRRRLHGRRRQGSGRPASPGAPSQDDERDVGADSRRGEKQRRRRPPGFGVAAAAAARRGRRGVVGAVGDCVLPAPGSPRRPRGGARPRQSPDVRRAQVEREAQNRKRLVGGAEDADVAEPRPPAPGGFARGPRRFDGLLRSQRGASRSARSRALSSLPCDTAVASGVRWSGSSTRSSSGRAAGAADVHGARGRRGVERREFGALRPLPRRVVPETRPRRSRGAPGHMRG